MTFNKLVLEQYQDPQRLQTRAEYHQKYGLAPTSLIDWVLNQLPLRGDEKVLDAGCGTGSFLFPLAKRLPKGEIIGIDLVPEMITYIKEKLSPNSNIQVQQADIINLPFADETFDIVMANFVLFHIEDIFAAIAECKRVLKSGGLAVFATNSIHNRGRLESIHRAAQRELSFPAEVIHFPSPFKRFSIEGGGDYLSHHFSWFEVHTLYNQYVVPETEAVLAYYTSGMIDWALKNKNIQVPASRLEQLRQLVAEKVEQIIHEEGGFRESQLSGFFLAHKSE
jgi:SAM-dependent methyltransferase